MSAEFIVDEMASAVRFLGGDGPAKEQNNRAARAAKLPVTVVERLRHKKNRRPFADIVDAVRAAVERHNEEGIARAKHETLIAQKVAAVAMARLREIDPDFYRPEIDRLGHVSDGLGSPADRVGGE